MVVYEAPLFPESRSSVYEVTGAPLAAGDDQPTRISFDDVETSCNVGTAGALQSLHNRIEVDP